MRLRKTFISLLIMIVFGSFIPGAVLAQTELWAQNTCDYLVKVKIVFDFQAINKSEAQAIINKWRSGLESVWNQNQEQIKLTGSCATHYDFLLSSLAVNKSCADYADSHCITVTANKRNQRGYLADATVSLANSGQNSQGEWTKNLSALAAAHEVGHMMGLADEYKMQLVNGQSKYVNNNQQDNVKQSIMAQVWGKAVALPSHHWQIISQAKSLLHLTE